MLKYHTVQHMKKSSKIMFEYFENAIGLKTLEP